MFLGVDRTDNVAVWPAFETQYNSFVSSTFMAKRLILVREIASVTVLVLRTYPLVFLARSADFVIKLVQFPRCWSCFVLRNVESTVGVQYRK